MQNKFLIHIIFFVLFLLVTSCKKEIKNSEKKAEKIEIITTKPNNFDMYKTSEMAGLMRMMLAKNKEVKENIMAGKDIGNFSKEFLAIHTVNLTDPSDRNASFETFSKIYINNMKGVFEVDKKNQKKAFNTAIQSCIACHKTTCSGPIPRIKKLLIE